MSEFRITFGLAHEGQRIGDSAAVTDADGWVTVHVDSVITAGWPPDAARGVALMLFGRLWSDVSEVTAGSFVDDVSWVTNFPLREIASVTPALAISVTDGKAS